MLGLPEVLNSRYTNAGRCEEDEGHRAFFSQVVVERLNDDNVRVISGFALGHSELCRVKSSSSSDPPHRVGLAVCGVKVTIDSSHPAPFPHPTKKNLTTTTLLTCSHTTLAKSVPLPPRKKRHIACSIKPPKSVLERYRLVERSRLSVSYTRDCPDLYLDLVCEWSGRQVSHVPFRSAVEDER